jgi:hypothetical protein
VAQTRKMPTIKSIVKYWQEHPDRAVEFGIEELDYAHCFACGYCSSEKSWRERTDYLERAHIIAHEIGGSSTPDNFVMLCKKCHADAPMCNEPKYMAAFIKSRPKYLNQYFLRYKENFAAIFSNYSTEEQEKISNYVESNPNLVFEVISKLQLGLHAGKMSEANQMILIIEVCKAAHDAVTQQEKKAK